PLPAADPRVPDRVRGRLDAGIRPSPARRALRRLPTLPGLSEELPRHGSHAADAQTPRHPEESGRGGRSLRAPEVLQGVKRRGPAAAASFAVFGLLSIAAVALRSPDGPSAGLWPPPLAPALPP